MLVPNIENLVKEEEKETYTIDINNIEEPLTIYKNINCKDPKCRKKLVQDIEKIIRTSYEYKKFIGCLKSKLDITRCTFHPDVDVSDTRKVQLEFHHYPFTLYDIVDTVLSKYLEESDDNLIKYFDIAEEVLKLHYELKIGLVPLSKTVHELAHNGKKFINLKYVYGSYLKFISEYNGFINPNLISNWQNLKGLSAKEDNGELKDNIMDQYKLIINMKNTNSIHKIKIETPNIA